jgi:Tol biopolymer transport system component
VPAAGGDVKRVGDSGGRIRGWSRDGRYLLIWRVPQGRNTIGVLDLTTGRAAETLRSDAGGLAGPRLSPDSRWVAFHSPDAPGSPVWVAPFRGDVAVPDAEWIMISERAGSPFWAPDGRSLYFARMQDGSPYATRLFRQPIDPVSGRPAGPAAEFYRLDGYSFSLPLLNTISATRDHVYMLLGGARSDIWTMELPN